MGFFFTEIEILPKTLKSLNLALIMAVGWSCHYRGVCELPKFFRGIFFIKFRGGNSKRLGTSHSQSSTGTQKIKDSRRRDFFRIIKAGYRQPAAGGTFLGVF